MTPKVLIRRKREQPTYSLNGFTDCYLSVIDNYSLHLSTSKIKKNNRLRICLPPDQFQIYGREYYIGVMAWHNKPIDQIRCQVIDCSATSIQSSSITGRHPRPTWSLFNGFSEKVHHHHHDVRLARISLTLSLHVSLSFITFGRSSGLHPVSSHSCCMNIRIFDWPYAGVHRSTSLTISSLLLQQCPACQVRLACIVFVIGGSWPYSWRRVGCCCQDLFNIARNILV